MQRSKILVRILFVFILLAGLLAGVSVSSHASVNAALQQSISTSIVISQVYGGGGNSGATYKNDFIELFNLGSSPVNITGWSVQYASATGTNWDQKTTLSGLIQPGQYYLIREAAGSGGTTDLPTPDAIGSIILGASSGKVALVNNSTALSGACPTSGLVDLVGYGNNANCSEGNAPAPALSNTTADIRITNGCTDTDNNSTDFTAGTPAPRNSSSPIFLCMDPATVTAAANLTGTVASGLTATASVTNLTATSIALTGTPTATTAPVYPPLSLVINEVAWGGETSCTSHTSGSNDEWVELYNPGPSPINLSAGWTLVGNYFYSVNFSIPLQGTIQAGGYFVLAENGSVFQNQNIINQDDSRLSLINSFQSLQLFSPGSPYPPVDTANNYGSYYWPAGSASPNYASMERYYPPGGTIPPDGPTAWVTYANPTSSSILDNCGNPVHGTPGGPNWASMVTETPSPVPTATKKPTPSPAPTPVPAVDLNEILPRPASDWNGDGVIDNGDEFIEVENLGPGVATLTNWRIDVIPSLGSSSFYIPSLKLNPNQRAVFFGSTTHLSLPDSGATVRLIDTYGVIEDAVTYPAAVQPDDSWCRIRDGIGPWRDGCFPTPGSENTLSGIPPPAPPPQAGQGAACWLPDFAPSAFRLAECNGPGADIWNPQYWNDLSGQKQYPVPDPKSKGETYIQ